MSTEMPEMHGGKVSQWGVSDEFGVKAEVK